MQSFRLPMIGTMILGAVIAIYLFAGRRNSKTDSAARIRKHTVKNSPVDTLKYWTEDRMRKAVGAEMPKVNEVAQEKEHPRRSPDAE